MTTSLLRHFHRDLPDYAFWFQNAYERLIDQLPTHQPSTWVEVGVYHGSSFCWLGVEVVNRGLPCTLHAVDSFVFGTKDQFYQNIIPIQERMGDRLHVHPVASHIAAKDFAPQSVDVIWIDADHTYNGVALDLVSWWPILKPGGWIGGDDYMPEYEGVIKAVDEFFGHREIPVELGTGQRNADPWRWWLAQKPGPAPQPTPPPRPTRPRRQR